MNAIEIVKQWLVEHGYDGLYNDDWDCACKSPNLAPAIFCEGIGECLPGYLADPEEDSEFEFLIVPEKPEKVR